jgi:hypothetical protein
MSRPPGDHVAVQTLGQDAVVHTFISECSSNLKRKYLRLKGAVLYQLIREGMLEKDLDWLFGDSPRTISGFGYGISNVHYYEYGVIIRVERDGRVGGKSFGRR